MSKRDARSHSECLNTLTAIGDALYVIGGKWKLRVIVTLFNGRKRFNEIQRTIEGISAKVLSSELKELELNGFVTRTVHAQTPVVVEYELTDYADTLNEVLASLSKWGAQHRDKLRQESKRSQAAAIDYR
ncbi:helix-turn-helix transcriptional regulator [Mucilaginibacter sp. 14171R-50]|uniref:winged helix-turn-helix transcriptional regulator n=1 Tax=Mucilaginibacter sp. 14171R-50 TaxID=2703789 RepID=UPI00138C1D89|nr:helix-turn-helix domain-containing protein [Mucilaginibacter sp. 14171R-50]QHS55003.1 helix-turn-helix transcriptional regulator [Mucilaginibacter sp. 14171R-50]